MIKYSPSFENIHIFVDSRYGYNIKVNWILLFQKGKVMSLQKKKKKKKKNAFGIYVSIFYNLKVK